MKKLILCLSLSLKSCKVKAGGQRNQQERIHDDCHACFGKYHTGKKMFRGDWFSKLEIKSICYTSSGQNG